MRKIAAFASVLLPLAAAAQGAGFDWRANLGLFYLRTDMWSPAGSIGSVPHLDVDLRLDTRGFVMTPDALRWNAGVGYRRISETFTGASERLTNSLTYQLGASIFENERSPFRLGLFASRTDSRLDGAAAVAGDVREQRLGGSVVVSNRRNATLYTQYLRQESSANFSAQEAHDRTVQRLTTRATNSAWPFQATAAYDGEWSEGNWTSDKYRDHRVTGSAGIDTGRGYALHLADMYVKHIPTTEEIGSYRADINNFSAAFRSIALPGDIVTARYQYTHGFAQSTLDEAESTAHSLRYEQDVRLSKSEYFIRGLADLSLQEQRTSSAALTSTGETVGAQLWFSHLARSETSLEWNVGPKVGFIQLPGGETRSGYGADAGLMLTGRLWDAYRGSIYYAVDWRSDLFGVAGWSIKQGLTSSIGGRLGDAHVNGSFNASAARGWSPVLGDQLSRYLNLIGDYSLRRVGTEVRLSLDSGTVNAVPASFADGFFLPVGFDRHSLTGILTVWVEIVRNLKLTVGGNVTRSTGPGQPNVDLWGAVGVLAYQYGAFELSAEDRYYPLAVQQDARGNQFMFRVSRRFGTY